MNSLKVPSLQSLVESDRGSNDSLLADSLQLDIEDLDDEEYAIPHVEQLPTLENVLTDMDADADSENVSEFGAFTAARPNGLLGSHATAALDGSDTQSTLDAGEPARMGTILRHVQLQGVSAQIASAADRINAGLATCLAITRPLTAVGTSHGHILAFDHHQTLRWCWSQEQNTTSANKSTTASPNHHQNGAPSAHHQGACSALAFNADSTRLLAGFSRGLIAMIDTKSGDTLRQMPDLITPNSGVLHLRWTEHPATALCSDSGGSVWTLCFTRRLGIRSAQSRCIFSGARGEVCTLEPLCFDASAAAAAADHPLRSFCVAALATLTKFVVVTVRPRLRVIRFRPLAGPAHRLPLLAWHMVLIQAGSGASSGSSPASAVRRAVDPVLCAAHGRSVYFHQLCLRDGRLHLLYLRHIQLAYDLLALHWLGPKTIAALDATERLHLHDIRSDRELEAIDMAPAGLVYGAAQFKAHATGGNVSPALALAGTWACYQSVVAAENRIYLLGGRAVHSVSVRAWAERVAHLVRGGRWPEACGLATDGWRSAREGRVVGQAERLQHAEETVRWLCGEWLERQRQQQQQGVQQGGVADMIDRSTKPTAASSSSDSGLDALIECIVETGCAQELLFSDLWDHESNTAHPERYLRALTAHIRRGAVREVAPAVAQALCAYWQHADPERLEQLVLLLDWRCLDLHLVLTAVRRECLWQAQIYLNAVALGDYCASLVDLVPLVLVEDRRLGNYLLVYISSCLAGRGYPSGEIAADRVAMVKHEVLRCLTAVHSVGAAADELPYPYLRTLLRFDTRDTLNVLALAFEEREFSGALGQSHRQRIIQILLEIMTPEEENESSAAGGDKGVGQNGSLSAPHPDATPWPEIGSLLNFIARQIAQRSLPEHSHTPLLERVMRYVRRERIAGETAGQLAEREHAWLELLHADCVPAQLTMGDQLRAARAARCLRVVELLLERRRCYEDILPCYLDAEAGRRDTELWAYVRRWAPSEQRQIFAQICNYVERLMRVDCAELVRVVRQCFGTRVPELLERVGPNAEALFGLMHELDGQRFEFDTEAAERYVALLVDYAPGALHDFLLRSAEYRVDRAIELVLPVAERQPQALAYLYERAGDYERAFAVGLRRLRAAGGEDEQDGVDTCVRELCSLCTRAAEVLAPAEAQHLWFEVVDAVLGRPDAAAATRGVLHAAARFVDLTALVQRVMAAQPQEGGGSGAASTFGDIRPILSGMLVNASYETRLLRGTQRVLNDDLHAQAERARRAADGAVRVTWLRCVVCRGRLAAGPARSDGEDNENPSSNEVLVLGGCGHAVHEACWPGDGRMPDGGAVRCPRCGGAVPDGGRSVGGPRALGAEVGAVRVVNREQAEVVKGGHRRLQVEAPSRIGIGGV